MLDDKYWVDIMNYKKMFGASQCHVLNEYYKLRNDAMSIQVVQDEIMKNEIIENKDLI